MTESRAGYARRIDAHLRAAFANLVTRIYEVSQDQFLITFPIEQQDANAIAETFDNEIRIAGVGVRLANTEPQIYLRELEPLSDADAAGTYVGLPIPIPIFNNLVTERFPDLPFIGVEEDFEKRVFGLRVAAELEEKDALDLVRFVDGLGLPFTSEVRLRPTPKAPAGSSGEHGGEVRSRPAPALQDPMSIMASRRRPSAPRFVRADEAFWFENLGAAADGGLRLDEFPGITPGSFRCFMDMSVGDHVNLRQALLLYDQVYCSFPLNELHASFLDHQKLSEADLLTAVEAGRLKFISTQPEERLRVPFLEAVAECRPDAILGRRTAALLLIADVAETADRYRLRDPSLYPGLQQLSEILAPQIGLKPTAWLKLLLWPFAARRAGLSGLLERGTKGGPALMLAEQVAEVIQAIAKKDLRLETLVLSERIHIGHALRATVIPPLSETEGVVPLMATLGHELNFFRSFNMAVAAAWAANERRRADGVQIVPAIPLLSFEVNVPMTEILQDGALGSVRAQGRALMHRLAELPAEQRPYEAEALADRFRDRQRRRAGHFLSFDNLDTGVSLASLFAHIVYPPLAGMFHVGGQAIDQLRRIPAIDAFAADFETDLARLRGGNEDLDFLSKISRVARIRREVV